MADPQNKWRGRSRAWLRVPCKLLIFGVVTLFVLFPNPAQLARHLSRVANLNAMITPDAPALDGLERDVRGRIQHMDAQRNGYLTSRRPDGLPPPLTHSPDFSPLDAQRVVEAVVLERVGYEWDWNQWGCADYMPTVDELFDAAAARGETPREDCDGRAVVAASLMRRLGYDARLVTDLRHVWVVTPQGQWMGPGGATTLASDESGTRFNAGTLLANIPISLSYGIAVFPMGRELIILVTAFVLMLRKHTSRRWAALGLLLLLQGLLFMRLGFFAPQAVSREASAWPAWIGAIHLFAGFTVLWRAGRRPHAAVK